MPNIRRYWGYDDPQAAYDFLFELMDFFDNAEIYAPDLEAAMNPDILDADEEFQGGGS
tara:strand:- start:2655 stop:2828 length:174 start_codon:yes stop_codon:yes gene_type:complete